METDSGLFLVPCFLLSLLSCIGLSCAIPVLPTGGPPDKVPPMIVESNPVSESVNVSTNSVRLVFSEFVDQASFAQSVSVTPAFDRPLQYRWRKKRVDITFPEPLRENTTYILNIDTGLRDVNRIALTEPLILAFATGPVINRGRITGQVIEPLQGTGVAKFDVFAYALADSTLLDSLPPSPAYRTQTDEKGAFKFDYMSEQAYFIIALQDRNRNRKPDGIEAFAVPPEPVLVADSAGTDPSLTWLVTRTDTIPPQLQRIRSISNQRFMLRFSESIQLLSRDPAQWSLKDSVSNQIYPIEDIYLYPEDPKQLYLKTPPLFATTHILQPGGIADSSGNLVAAQEHTFKPSANSDTLQLRFLGFYPKKLINNEQGAAALSPGQRAGIRFNQPVKGENLTSFVSIQDTSKQSYAYDAGSTDGSIFYLTPRDNFPVGAPFTLSINGSGVGAPDTTYTKLFQQLTDEGLGELSGVAIIENRIAPRSITPDTTAQDSTAQDSTAQDTIAQDSTAQDSTTVDNLPVDSIAVVSSGQIVVELFPATYPPPPVAIDRKMPDASGTFVFSNLPDKAKYKFRAFVDMNANQKWDGGQLIPYLDAEPLAWYSDSLQVRARWEQTLSDTLRIKTR